MKALKFKHIYGEVQREKFEQINASSITCDSTMIKSNAKYTALIFGSGGGGVLCVLDNNKPLKIPMDFPMIKGHQGSILDLDWYPFDDQFVATSSIDNTVKIWQIPQDFSQDLTEAQTTLYGHDKKVNVINWNPTAEFIIATGSYDSTLKVWDVQKGEAALTLTSTAQAPQSIEWNETGNLLGTTWNDKKVRIGDPRSKKFETEVDGHLGTKPSRFQWLGTTGYYVTVGFNKNHEREYSLWNISKPESPVDTQKIDSGSGVMFPFWDDALGMLYIVGKGDSSIKYWEFMDGKLYYINSFNSNLPGKGYSFFPKRALDVAKCEIMKAAKLGDKVVEFVSFVAPRKSTNFQEDLFPDCLGTEAAMTSEEWFGGKTSKPKYQSMKPENMSTKAQADASIKFAQKDKPQNKALNPELEITELKLRVVELEKELYERDTRISQLEHLANELKQSSPLKSSSPLNQQQEQ